MLVIRFLRVGKKNQPSFKIVVIDKRKASTHGRFVEEVGFYNPQTKEKFLRTERVKYWLSVGAKPSPTVHNLLISEKIIEGKKIDVHKKVKEKEEKPVEPAVETQPKQKERKEEVSKEEKSTEEKPAEEKKEEKPTEESSKEEHKKE